MVMVSNGVKMKVISSERIPIKMWLDDIEEGALEQAKNLANLPFATKHIALMPDCLTDNTEILSDKGFVLIKDLDKNTNICNYDSSTGKVFFAPPINIINRPVRENEIIYGFTNCSTDKQITVSEKHRMPYTKNMGLEAKNIPTITTMEDFIWGGLGTDTKDYDISDELLCLIAWIVGDGNIKMSNKRLDGEYSSINIRFGITKERKTLRICSLLNSLAFKYSIRTTPKQTTITISVKYSKDLLAFLDGEKKYPIKFISSLSTRQALVFLEECIKVDGDWLAYQKYNTVRYNSSRVCDIDFLSALISMHFGLARDNTRYTEGFGKYIEMHLLQAVAHSKLVESKNGIHKTKIHKSIIEYSGNLVCVTCDSGFFIARQNGLTFVTGNCHQGYGMPIGGVMATEGVIVPNAVGVDIGCGCAAVKTDINKTEIQDKLKDIMSDIRGTIPVGFSRHRDQQSKNWIPTYPKLGYFLPVINAEYESALYQIGTLGGGNHFIEFQVDEKDCVWIMIHSGSRNLGYKVARYYNNIAIKLNEKWFSSIPKKWDLAFLPFFDEDLGQTYFNEMNFCVEFAKHNRALMMDFIMGILFNHFPKYYQLEHMEANIIDIAHNYAVMENHFGKNVVVHRKGATRAYEGEIGIIPGSQGTASYIVEGLGNEQSFKSCSHGAGRKMGRKQAKRELDLETEKKRLDDLGIIHSVRSIDNLDEASGAYKDIDVVMENQKDLVKIVTKLQPIAVIKG